MGTASGGGWVRAEATGSAVQASDAAGGRHSPGPWRWVLAGVGLASFVLLVTGRGELAQTWQVLRSAQPGWVAGAFVLQGLFFVDEAWLYRLLYERLAPPGAVHLPWASMVHLTLAGTLLSRLFPAAGLPLFVAEGRRLGVPGPISTAVNVLFYLLDYLTFLILALVAVALFSWRGTLTAADLLGTLLLAILVGGVSGAGVLAIRRPERLHGWAQTLVNWGQAQGRDWGKLLGVANQLGDGLTQVEAALRVGRSQTGLAIRIGTAAAMIQVIDVALIWVLFHAFSTHLPDLTVVVAGYALASALSLVSFIPSGLGVFEVSMAVVYHTSGVSLALASAVTVGYRLLSTWLPIPAGWPSLRWLARQAAAGSSGGTPGLAKTRQIGEKKEAEEVRESRER